MVVLFKHQSKKYAYDTVTGALIPLSSLAHRMVAAMEPPLPPYCPTALRYELAKYDAADVNDAYAGLYQYYDKGQLFATETGVLRTPQAEEELLCAALTAAADALPYPVFAEGDNAASAKAILQSKNKFCEKHA